MIHVIRAVFSDSHGIIGSDELFGGEQTVFIDSKQAEARCRALNEQSPSLDWGDCSPPHYYVERVNRDTLRKVEAEQLWTQEGWQDPGCTSHHGHDWRDGKCVWCKSLAPVPAPV